jgi:hypothetical protein
MPLWRESGSRAMAAVAVACLLVVFGGISAKSQPSPHPGVTRFPALDSPPARLTEGFGHFLVPPSGAVPKVAAEVALALAWGERAPGGADKVTATFAIFDHPTLTPPGGVPAWLISYQGACLPNFGAYGHETSGCYIGTWDVVLNSDTGEFLLSSSS